MPTLLRSPSAARVLRSEGPRERLLANGADTLSDAELVAVLLGTGVPGASALTVASALLSERGGVGGLLDLEAAALAALPGVGPARAARLRASLALAERYAMSSLRREQALTSPQQTAAYLRLRLRRREREVFAVVLLDTQHRVIRYDELFFGTIDGTSVYPREVVRAVLRHNAAAVILAHNHPSGIAEPSGADIRLTDRLRAALALIDVRVLDHLIVGDTVVTSLAERGLLSAS